MVIKMNGKRISQKQAKEILGATHWAKRLAEAREEHEQDPYTLLEWMDGMEIIFD